MRRPHRGRCKPADSHLEIGTRETPRRRGPLYLLLKMLRTSTVGDKKQEHKLTASFVLPLQSLPCIVPWITTDVRGWQKSAWEMWTLGSKFWVSASPSSNGTCTQRIPFCILRAYRLTSSEALAAIRMLTMTAGSDSIGRLTKRQESSRHRGLGELCVSALIGETPGNSSASMSCG